MSVGLVLTGGSLRGICAEVGALMYLHELGIRYEVVVGTSAGSIVGALYCSGMEPAAIADVVANLKLRDYADFDTSGMIIAPLKLLRGFDGIIKGDRLRKILMDKTGGRDLAETDPPLHIMVTNVSRREAQMKSAGPAAIWARASSAIPFVFQQEYYEGEYYVDGGVSNNIPLNDLILKYPSLDHYVVVSALSLEPESRPVSNRYMKKILTPLHILARLPEVLVADLRANNLEALGKSVYRLRVQIRTNPSLLDPKRCQEAIQQAYDYTKETWKGLSEDILACSLT